MESDAKKSSKVKELKKTPSKPAEPTLSFDQILKLAAAKQHGPAKIEKKIESFEKKPTEEERPMTKKEKEDLMRRKQEERERQLRRQAREAEGISPIAGKSTNTNAILPNKPKEPPIPKASSSKEFRKPNSLPSKPPEKLSVASSSSSAQKSSAMSGKLQPPQTRPVQQVGRSVVQPNSAKPGLSKGPAPSIAGKKPPIALAKPSLKEKSIPNSREPSRPFPPYSREHPMERPFKPYKRK